MVYRIFLPAYSDRIAQDLHLIPSLTGKFLLADALELGYGIYTLTFYHCVKTLSILFSNYIFQEIIALHTSHENS